MEQASQSELERLLACHRSEKKELQARIQKMKKSVKDESKKRKKEIAEEIFKLEKELKEKQQDELQRLQLISPSEIEISAELSSVSLQNDVQKNEDSEPRHRQSKASKRREKKAKEAREREERIKEQEELNIYSSRNIEAEKMNRLLLERNLGVYEIKPDGDCLFASIAHQMESATVCQLRQMAACFIRENAADFLPFIPDPTTGDLMSDTQFEDYCNSLENSPLWGGQPELRALSQVLRKPIEVIQAEGVPIIFGEEYSDSPKIQLAYYRHSYGLGEHYNSVAPIAT